VRSRRPLGTESWQLSMGAAASAQGLVAMSVEQVRLEGADLKEVRTRLETLSPPRPSAHAEIVRMRLFAPEASAVVNEASIHRSVYQLLLHHTTVVLLSQIHRTLRGK